MPEFQLKDFNPKISTISCRFDGDGIVQLSEGSFLSEELAAGANALDICDFLVGTIEHLDPGQHLLLQGMHLETAQRYIVDANVWREYSGESYVLSLEDCTRRYRAINALSQQRNEADIL